MSDQPIVVFDGNLIKPSQDGIKPRKEDFENDSSHMEKGLFFQDPNIEHQQPEIEKSESEVDSNNFDAFDAVEDIFEDKKRHDSSGSEQQFVQIA